MITRRTLRRTHLLRPDPKLNNLFLYCLAVTSRRFGVLVHAATVMSTHEHLVVTDTRGVLPRFTQELHRLLALGIKSLRKWEGAAWDHEKTSVATRPGVSSGMPPSASCSPSMGDPTQVGGRHMHAAVSATAPQRPDPG